MKIPILISWLLIIPSLHNQLAAQASERCLTDHPAEDRYASYSPDGSSILFESNRNGNWDLFIMDNNGGNVKALTNGSDNERRPYWHPSGKKVIFENVDKNQLIHLDISTKEQNIVLEAKELLNNGIVGNMNFARYAPKGDKFVFTIQENDTLMNILVYHIKEGSIEEVFYNPYRTAFASWSPKGNHLVFHSRHETNNSVDEIYTLNTKDNSIRRLTEWPKHNFCPMFSNNGKMVAYATSMENSRPEIYVMEKNGSKQKRITFNEDGDTLPFWSPDDSRLLITAFRNGNYEICEITLNPAN